MSDKQKGKGAEAAMSRRQQRKIEEQKAAQRKRLMQIGGVVLAALLVVGLVVLLTRPDEAALPELPAVAAVAAPDAAIPQEGLVIGSADAPVTIIEYGDYQCPWCATFNTDGFQPMLAEYIATGKVRFEFRPFSFLGQESVNAAKAGFCAADQGKFWAMHELIYGNHNGENLGAYGDERLAEMAGLAGLDMDAYQACYADPATAERVEAANQVARDAGVSSTPTFVVNGEVVGWPQEGYPVFRDLIESKLAGA